jgi:hypothetical protein
MEKIYKAMSAVMADIGPVGKDQKAEFGSTRYKYRGIDDLINAANPALTKHGVIVAPNVVNLLREDRKSSKGGDMIFTVVTMEYTFYAEDGSNIVVSVIGEGADSGDKGANKAMTSAYKYALGQALAIATDMVDSETDDPQVGAKAVAPAKAPAKKPTPKKETVEDLDDDPIDDLRDSQDTGDYAAKIASFTSKKELISWYSTTQKTDPSIKDHYETVKAKAQELN